MDEHVKRMVKASEAIRSAPDTRQGKEQAKAVMNATWRLATPEQRQDAADELNRRAAARRRK